MVNINTYNNEEMVLIQFCGNIFFWMFSRVDHKSVTDVGLIDSFLANPSLLKSNFFLSEHSPNTSFRRSDKIEGYLHLIIWLCWPKKCADESVTEELFAHMQFWFFYSAINMQWYFHFFSILKTLSFLAYNKSKLN